tara:strand:- start:2095 stop:2973 length:879 start_codon:yes stop_codon:yes gene_type:complete
MEISYKIEKIQKNFKNLINLDKKIESQVVNLKKKLDHLKEMHSNMSKSNNKQVFLFCLDSFYFQYKLFSMDLENLNKFNLLMKNRMYCDYYKLYKLILKYMNDNKEELDIETKHSLVPNYKDLEPYFDYGFENINLVHNNMLSSVKDMYTKVLEKDELIKEYTTKKQAGYSISNFVNTLTHENYILKSQIDLYLNYISFFHISQQKQIKRLYDNYVNFEKELDSNISSEHAFSFDDLVEENMFDELHLDSDIKVEEIEKPETLEPITDTVPSHEDNTLQSEEKTEIPEFKGL